MKFLLSLLIFISATVCAKEVKVIVPYSAGGPTDLISRLLVKHLNTENQYKFIPEYKLGAGGLIAINHVIASKDETTLMVISNALVALPITTPMANYTPDKDLQLVEYLGQEPLVMVVKNDGQINNFKEFRQHSTTQIMPYGTAGIGTSQYLTSIVIANNNSNMIHVPYKGSSGIVIDLLNGNLKWLVDSEVNVKSLILDKKIKPIAIYSNSRLPDYPTVPTVKELKVDNLNFYRWHVLVANKNADPEVLKYVSSKLKTQSFKNELSKITVMDTPNLQNFLLDESVKVRRIVRDFTPR